jgi:hypothetical protein
MFHGFLLPRGPRSSEEPTGTRFTGSQPRVESAPPRVTMRLAEPADERALVRLAALDSRRLPAGRLVVGEMGGAIQAAVPLAGGDAIANPFVHTDELVKLLELRAEQLREREAARHNLLTFARRRPTLAGRAA